METLIITRPDKASGGEMMDRSDYISKMQIIFNDNEKYLPLPRVNPIHLSI